MPIRILDAATVGRIAAGEVVERPSSVVKELIENSLDAGATSITVEVKGGGIDYLRVTDNGCGIEPGQVRLAFENHATSKLQRAEQLDDIRTLGFRGEALPSIAAVSRVEMTTRAKNQESGTKLTIEGGQNMQVKEAGCPQGTTIIMRDLFYNVPVRRAFLKKPAYEGGLVSDAVAKLLLGNPNVSMRFISGGSTLFSSFGDGKLRHAVFAVYGRETAENMVELDASEGGTRIYGMIGVGELAKATRSHQLFFINGRSVRCPLLTKALEQVCRSRVTIGMYPMCVLNLVMPASGVDVNVHPNKLEVRFRDADQMRAACERLLEKAFEGEHMLEIEKLTEKKQRVERKVEVRELPTLTVPGTPDLPESDQSAAAPEEKKPLPRDVDYTQRPVGPTKVQPGSGPVLLENDSAMLQSGMLKVVQVRTNISKKEGNAPLVRRVIVPREVRSAMDMPPIDETPDFSKLTAERNAADDLVNYTAPRVPVKPRQETMDDIVPEQKKAPPFRVVGVVFKTYILVETGNSLLLIDQHAAHERLQYEKLMKRVQDGNASQQLLTPFVLHLSAREMALVQDNLDALAEAGYGIEPFGKQDIRITGVPFILGRANIQPAFVDVLQGLTRLKSAALEARRTEIMQMACKSAVKAGDALTDSEISALIHDMMETGAPPTCPHGRPVVKTLTKRDLEKMFKRIQ